MAVDLDDWDEVECPDCGGFFEFTGVDEEGRDCYFDCDTAECCACGRERQIAVNDDGHAYVMVTP